MTRDQDVVVTVDGCYEVHASADPTDSSATDLVQCRSMLFFFLALYSATVLILNVIALH